MAANLSILTQSMSVPFYLLYPALGEVAMKYNVMTSTIRKFKQAKIHQTSSCMIGFGWQLLKCLEIRWYWSISRHCCSALLLLCDRINILLSFYN